MIGQLFTQDFLKTGIGDTPAWQGITDAELDAFIADLKTIYAPYKAGSNLNEPMTENEILVRVLVKLGWTDILTQQIASKTRREDVADMLLLPNAAAKGQEIPSGPCRERRAVAACFGSVTGASRYDRSWPRRRARYTSGLRANKTRARAQLR